MRSRNCNSTVSSNLCDLCGIPLKNKTAVYCEECLEEQIYETDNSEEEPEEPENH